MAAAAAEGHFRQALDRARRQGAGVLETLDKPVLYRESDRQKHFLRL
jgi:hypothetical protein